MSTPRTRTRWLLGIVTGLGGCLAEAPQSELADARAHELLREIRAADYGGWFAPADSGMEPAASAGPHGPLTVVYISPILEEAAAQMLAPQEDPPRTWPVGSMAVSETFDSMDSDSVALLQVATRGDDGWTWAQYDERDRVLAYGRVGTCIGCHAAGQDFLFSVSLPQK